MISINNKKLKPNVWREICPSRRLLVLLASKWTSLVIVNLAEQKLNIAKSTDH